MALIKLEDVSKFYKTQEGVSSGMRDVSLAFDLNEFVAITGESGSGKSTLLNVISGLDGYEEGEMYIDGEETSHFTISDWEKYRSEYIGFIFQNYNIIDSYTVYQNVMLALDIQNYPKKNRKARALELIDKVGLTSHKNHKASKLSGGQKQRAVIARALAKDCPIIVADEPTGNLDSETSKQVISLLKDISKDKLVIIVTHNYEEVSNYATRKITMYDGQVTEDISLKPFDVIEKIDKPHVANISFGTLIMFALRNTFAMPRRFVFFLLLHTLVAFSFLFVYANMVSGLSRSSGSFMRFEYLDSYNMTENRLPSNRMIITKKNNDLFTNTEIENLKNSEYEIITDSEIFDAGFLYFHSVSNRDVSLNQALFDSDFYLNANLKNLNIKTDAEATVYPVIASKNLDLIVGDTFKIEYMKSILTEYIGNVSEDKYQIASFRIVGITDDYENKLYFSSQTLNDLFTDAREGSLFLSLSFKSYVSATKFLDVIDKVQYRVFYPHSSKSDANIMQVWNIAINFFSILLVLLVGIFLYFVVHAVTKNYMASRKKDFAIYRSIGANQKILAYLVIVEQILILIFAVVFLSVILIVLNSLSLQMTNILGFLRFKDYVMVIMILLCFTIWLGLRFNKKVFNFSVIETLSQSKEEVL